MYQLVHPAFFADDYNTIALCCQIIPGIQIRHHTPFLSRLNWFGIETGSKYLKQVLEGLQQLFEGILYNIIG